MQKAMNTFYVSTSTVGLQRSERARSMLSAGQPLAGYVDSNDRKKEQQAIKLKFWLHVVNGLSYSRCAPGSWRTHTVHGTPTPSPLPVPCSPALQRSSSNSI